MGVVVGEEERSGPMEMPGIGGFSACEGRGNRAGSGRSWKF